MMTADHKPERYAITISPYDAVALTRRHDDRLNIHTGEDGTVRKVTHG